MAEYSLEAYGGMIMDRTRFEAHVQAMRQTIRPGDVVLDIGTGTGIFALIAARLGARHVYAVEPSDAAQLGIECAAASGLDEIITFHQGLSTQYEPPDRADVIISDLRGVLPLHGAHIPSIIDARTRLLTPGGTLIPQEDTVKTAIVSSPAVWERLAAPWDGRQLGLDLTPALCVATHRWRSAVIGSEDLITPPLDLFTLDYRSIASPNAAGKGSVVVERSALAHGLAVWFDALLTEGVTLTTAPGEQRLVYGHAFFPWPEPVPLQAGDRAAVSVRADSVGGHYEWRWRTRVTDQSGNVRTEFDQSTLSGRILSPSLVHKRAATTMPVLSAEGRALASALAMFDGTHDLATAAAALSERFSERFKTAQDALDFVAAASVRFGD